jgi:hypothetical protein
MSQNRKTGNRRTISYLKISGPPLLKAIKKLEEISLDLPEVCIMDQELSYMIEYGPEDVGGEVSSPSYGSSLEYFSSFIGSDYANLTQEICDKAISKSGESLGEYDFYFEWFKEPTSDQLNALIEKIDEALEPIGVSYTITTKKK